MEEELEYGEFEICLVWAKMPLSDEELERIPPSHRVRPYLLCQEKEGFYYAFPATSQVYTDKTRYQNEKVILRSAIDDKKSLVNLGKVYILPEENILGNEYLLNEESINEIVKKIKANFEFGNYPEDFKEEFRKKEIKYTYNDLIEIRGMLYVVVGFTQDDKLIVLPVYKYPVNKTVLAETDGLKYHVDTKNISTVSKENVDKYHSQLHGFALKRFRKEVEDEVRIKELLERYRNCKKIKNKKDYSKFNNLEPGMIIEYTYNGITYKMIILENNETDIEALIGYDKETYSRFEPINLPSNISLNYNIVGTLNDERLEDLIIKSSYKLNGYGLTFKK